MKMQQSIKILALTFALGGIAATSFADQLQVGDTVINCKYTNQGGEQLVEPMLRSGCYNVWHGTEVTTNKASLPLQNSANLSKKDCKKQFTAQLCRQHGYRPQLCKELKKACIKNSKMDVSSEDLQEK